MIGLEYILALYNYPHTKLAEQLGISRQNINLWIKGKGKIPKKYIPQLRQLFSISEEYYQKEIDEVDRLVIQKEKLKKELDAKIVGHKTQLKIGENGDLYDEPIYNYRQINEINHEIKKVKLLNDLKGLLVDERDYEIQIIEQVIEMLKKQGNQNILLYTIDALSHYYDVLPSWVGAGYEWDEYVREFIDLAKRYDKNKNN